MPKTIAVGAILFVLGVVVGRLTALTGSPVESAHEAPAAAAPGTPAPAAAMGRSGEVMRGRVAEVIQVPQYTYLRFEAGQWAAVESTPSLAVGQTVGVSLQTQMQDFTSKALGRTFASIWFGTLEGAQPAGGPDSVVAEPAAEPAPPSVPVPAVAGPTLSLRITDIYSERAMLAGRRVKVKATVDRVNTVQGVHYVHLKDGTGSATDKTDDLLAITTVELEKGAALVVEGVVAVDKNVGMGVNPVVLDQAAAVK